MGANLVITLLLLNTHLLQRNCHDLFSHGTATFPSIHLIHPLLTQLARLYLLFFLVVSLVGRFGLPEKFTDDSKDEHDEADRDNHDYYDYKKIAIHSEDCLDI